MTKETKEVTLEDLTKLNEMVDGLERGIEDLKESIFLNSSHTMMRDKNHEDS